MLRSYDPLRSTTVFRFPDPPTAPSPTEPNPVVVHKVDWEELGFSENKGRVALIIDNAFTLKDCQKLLKAAEDSAPWSVAAVHRGPGDTKGVVAENYRRSSRILLDNVELADFILSKLKPHMPEEAVDAPKSKYWQFKRVDSKDNLDKLKKKAESTDRVQLTRLNERLRYLKYVEGDFFESHCDGTYWTPDRSEISCLTLQLYLNGSEEDLEGGATQFLSHRIADRVIDVDPRPGRALIFEQGNVLHCGAKVLKGEKYTIRTDLMFKEVSP
ncbi:hypothetical protein M407DRAFT_219775 [Tulasnella calospora MUT 4182]|uniref:Fe2OG dioxygenase domain-containing protein n=1 Tax=Tulasnella calospora MUT 4182 TaxID=1051891 RepID=A0A0C3QHQ0_9AGAM|nr:hypothetical protein M407DRAFT_219775 [Tulasnella calospora MUT 4182]